MTQQEIEKLYHLPFPLLAEACQGKETLAETITLAINMGIKLGKEQTHLAYNRMFKGYNEVSIEN